MYWRQSGDTIAVSQDGAKESFTFGSGTFADIAYVAAWPNSESIILTAARAETDRADVEAGRRGNYRAYRVSRQGIEQLTDEYTNTAIPMPGGAGLAYSNGASLVIARGDHRLAYQVGRFSWGPVSLSCDATGRWVAMTKWKGDSRKVAFIGPTAEALVVSKFSHYSYLLHDEQILYENRRGVFCYSPQEVESRSISTVAEKRRFLDLIGIAAARINDVQFSFGHLSSFQGRPIASVGVQDAKTFEWLWSGLVSLPVGARPWDILHVPEAPWRVRNISSAEEILQVSLERYEEARLVEVRRIFVGRTGEPLSDGWEVINTPRVADHQFQFVP